MKLLSFFTTAAISICGAGLLQAQSTKPSVPSKILESYVGQYELAPGFTITIRKEGERLTGQVTGQPRFGLTPKSAIDFEVSGVEASVTFATNKDGKIDHLVLHQNGDHDAQRISDSVPKERVAIHISPKLYDAYAGQYELAPGAVMTIRRDGDKLRAQLTGQPNFEIFPESETNFFYKVVDAQLTFARDSSGKVTELVLHQNGDKTARKISDEATPIKGPDLSKIPARDPKTPAALVDLTGKYYSALTEQWHPNANGLPEGVNDLRKLPAGVHKLADVDFDVRGVIQLTGTQAEFAGAAFPDSATGIKLGRKCKRLHVLHGTGWRTEDGTLIGKYVLHYSGGETATLNIVYGVDARDWWSSNNEPKETKSASVAWSGSNPAADAVGGSLRLYKRTYENPKPALVIETLDFVSAKSDSAPFVIAVTLEE